VAFRLKASSDIVKGYDFYPLVAKTTPKNTLIIKTSNSKDWTDYSTYTPLVSSTLATSGSASGASLSKVSGTYQSLIFSMKAPFSDVSKAITTPSTPITNNWGFLIMMSPKIYFNPSQTLAFNE
jgi:hypothetical protein